jgi:hypothetical protein
VNAELVDYATKIVTIRGKKTMRNGFALLQVEQVRKFWRASVLPLAEQF